MMFGLLFVLWCVSVYCVGATISKHIRNRVVCTLALTANTLFFVWVFSLLTKHYPAPGILSFFNR